jgi:hypothetical protein
MFTCNGRGGLIFPGLLVIALICTTGSAPAKAGPNRDAALQSCKSIYDDQKLSCAGSNSYAACMTMITDKYESCKADAETIVDIRQIPPSAPNTGLRRTGSGLNAVR